MDPNAALRELLQLKGKYIDGYSAVASDGELADDMTRMSELIDALDGWLSKGGFLPSRWERK